MESDINKNLDFRRTLLVDFGECTHTHAKNFQKEFFGTLEVCGGALHMPPLYFGLTTV